jgi:tetratricopeptide (TPR) repeat protein
MAVLGACCFRYTDKRRTNNQRSTVLVYKGTASAMIQFFVVRTGRPEYKGDNSRLVNKVRDAFYLAVGPLLRVGQAVHPKNRELRVRGRWLWVLALVWCVARFAIAHGATAVIAEVDARAEIAAALFAASATQAAAERVADGRIRSQRKEIEELRVKVRGGDAQRKADLTAAEEKYVAALAERDRAYAQEIAVFRKAVENIAATPEGATALARFNAGDEIGALMVLDTLRAARDAARKKRADIESAAEGRRIATLALEARNKGKLATAQIIARYEQVTRLDPAVHSDWVELGRLYRDAGNLPGALCAARSAAETAEDGRERSVALNAIGDVQVDQGDLTAALTSYRASLAIRERLAKIDPGNAEWQRDLSISHDRVGNVQRAQGDLPAALTSYRASLAIRERLAKVDPGNAGWQRDLSLSHEKLGDVQVDQGDLTAALTSYRASLAIRERLAKTDPGNAQWQRDLIVSYVKLSDVTGDKTYDVQALKIVLAMQKRGILAPRDGWMIEELRRRAGQ